MSLLLKTSLKYGLICGIMICLAFYSQFLIGINPVINLNSFFIDIVIFFGFVFFGSKEFKDYKNEGYLHFWQGISIGLVIILLSSVIFTAFSATYYTVNQEIFNQYVQNAIEVFQKQKDLLLESITLEQYEENLEELKKTTISDLILTDFFKKMGVGFLVTPVVAILLRKQKQR